MNDVSELSVVVSEDLCQGHGVCESVDPELFHVGDDGLARVDASVLRQLTKADLSRVEAAARACPARAIEVTAR